MKLTFLGANQQVTGSRYCLHAGDDTVMIDCGLFQEREFANRNREPCPITPDNVNALLLTHAHIDHSGLIPRFVRDGYRNPILATRPTVELAKILLRDSAEIQQEDASYKQKRHRRENRTSKRAEPLYEISDAERAIRLFRGVDYGQTQKIGESISVTFHDAGHILGSAMLEITVMEEGVTRTIVFSGDIGQWNKPLIEDPTFLEQADYVVMESTYGNRNHSSHGNPEDELARIINQAAARQGKIVIPTFAVERAQELMYYISRLVHADRIPNNIPVFLDSPMAIDVRNVFEEFEAWLDEESRELLRSNEPPLRFPGLRMTRTPDESRDINRVRGSCIIMSTSGMCTAGRIKHHLRQTISDNRNTILFVGYQGRGTLGREILEGSPTVRIHGRQFKVHADIEKINGFSAHADQAGLLKWIDAFKPAPRRVFLTHGEESVAFEFAKKLEREYGLNVSVPQYDSTADL